MSNKLRNQIQNEIKGAMKAQEKQKLEALRYLWSLIQNREIDAKQELGDGEVIKIVKSEVKKRKEAIEQIKAGGRDEMVKDEVAKLEVIEEFLPEQMREEEVSELVDQVIGELGEKKDFGVVMGQVMKKTGGNADGKLVSEMVKEKLGGGK